MNNDAFVQDNDKETLTDKATLERQAKNTNITLYFGRNNYIFEKRLFGVY